LAIRRVFIPDDDRQLSDPKLTLAGESLFLMPLSNYLQAGSIDGLKAAFAGEVGAASNDRCAIMDGKNDVRFVVNADPSILDDTKGLPNGWYFVEAVAPTVRVGMSYNKTTGVFS